MKEMKTLNGYEIVDDAARKKVTELQNTILEKMSAPNTEIGVRVEIDPVPGTKFAGIVTTMAMPGKNVAGDWQNPDNWETIDNGDHLLTIYRFPISAGDFDINYTFTGEEDCPMINLYEIDTDGSWSDDGRRIEFSASNGEYSDVGCFTDPYGSGMAAIVCEAPCYGAGYSHLTALEILIMPQSIYLFDNGFPTLTISNGTETKTYEYDSENWGYPMEAIAYNWTTGECITDTGEVYEGIGVPIEIEALPGTNILESSQGATEVTYMAYPGAVIEKLQKEITALKAAKEE